MGEHEVNVECALKHQKHSDQIATLKEAEGSIVEDIAEIKSSLSTLDAKVGSKFSELKIWILSSAVAGLLVLLGEAIYFGGRMHQIDVDSTNISELQRMHPRVGKSIEQP